MPNLKEFTTTFATKIADRHISKRYMIFLTISFFVSFVLKIFLVNPWLSSAESINFASSLIEYKISDFAPHPPGFPVFYLLIKAISFLNLPISLNIALPSIIFSSLAVFPLFSLTKRIAGSPAGVSAVLLYMFNPYVLFMSVQADEKAIALFITLITASLFLKTLLLPDYLRRHTKFSSFYFGIISFGFGLGASPYIYPLFISILILSIYGFFKLQRKRIFIAVTSGIIEGIALWLIPFLIFVNLGSLLTSGINFGFFYDNTVYTLSENLADFFSKMFCVAGLSRDLPSYLYAIPLLIIHFGIIMSFLGFKGRFRELFIFIFYMPFLILLALSAKHYDISYFIVLAPFIIMLYIKGLRNLIKNKIAFYVIISVLLIFQLYSVILNYSNYKNNISPYIKTITTINKMYNPSNVYIYGGKTIRILEYYNPEFSTAYIENFNEFSKKHMIIKTKERKIILTSEIKDLPTTERLKQIGVFYDKKNFFNKDTITLYELLY